MPVTSRTWAFWAALGCAATACFDWSTPPHGGDSSDGGGGAAVDGGATDAPSPPVGDGGGDAAADDCPTCSVVADDLEGPLSSLSATPDGTRLYWIGHVTTDDGIWSHVVGAGGASVSFSKKSRLVTANDDAVFFADSIVLRLDVDGGVTRLSPPSVDAGALTWADLTLRAALWANGTQLMQCATPATFGCDGGLLTFDTAGTGAPSAVAGMAGLADYVAIGTLDGRLLRTASTTTLGKLDNVAGASATAVIARGGFADGDDEIVWAASTATTGSLRRVFRKAFDVMLDVGAPVVALAFDGNDVVFATRDAAGAFSLARVDHTLSTAAGAPRTFATNQRGVTRVAVASDGVYFTRERADGAAWQLVRAAR